VNDSKNLILAVVLSALVLLGWTWLANKYFPTANPPTAATVAGKQQSTPQQQPQQQAPAQAAPAATKALRPVSAGRDPHTVADGIDQPQGGADR
jgi:YidC/Oxa1 family membrane protein insertase